MASPILFALEPELPLQQPLQHALSAESGDFEMRKFPDGETYLRIHSVVERRHCILLANLFRPDGKILPLQFIAHTLRSLGAASVGLVAPYLCYMRQDKVFHTGEALTSRIFANIISSTVDWLATVDPHLHRYKSLNEIYSIGAHAISGTPALHQWIAAQPGPLLLVGPDAESRQWVAALAHATGHPFIVGEKLRRGDRDVQVRLPRDPRIATTTAVIVDDVIASGHTVLETIAALKTAGAPRVVCAAVHGVFADDADEEILRAGADQLAVSNSIPGHHCAFDLAPLLVPTIRQELAALAVADNRPGGRQQ